MAMKTCSKCETPKEHFPRNAKMRDGLSSWCNDCHREYMRSRPGNPEKRRAAARPSASRRTERRRPREHVKDAIRAGQLAQISTQVCVDCGAQARAYDHHIGYQHPLEVQPVCFVCHGLRSRKRGEHGKARAGRILDGREWNEFPTL